MAWETELVSCLYCAMLQVATDWQQGASNLQPACAATSDSLRRFAGELCGSKETVVMHEPVPA